MSEKEEEEGRRKKEEGKGRRMNAWLANSNQWLRTNLFNSPFNTLVTLLIGYLLLQLIPFLFSWLIIDSAINSTAEECRQASGACWSFIQEKWLFIIFGRYPAEAYWRPALAMFGFLLLVVFSKDSRRWNKQLGLAWFVFIVFSILLITGGWFGLPKVDNDLWGGLLLTLILSTAGIVCAYPLGILLALGRRSKLPAIKSLCVIYIEFIRGVPLITLLFMASIMLPLFLPDGMNINNLLRAQLAIILFSAAYLAEVVRGGLQAIPKGQLEASVALGLSAVQALRFVILPQALRVVVPATVSTFISIFKDTSLVLIIGLMDLMLSAKTATIDTTWRGFSTEAYLFTAAIYFVFCFSMGRYSRRLEVKT